MGYYRKICPLHIEEVGLPDFCYEILSWISRVFEQILIFTQISRNDPHMHPKSILSCFLTLDFQEKLVKQLVEFQTFYIPGIAHCTVALVGIATRYGTQGILSQLLQLVQYFISNKAIKIYTKLSCPTCKKLTQSQISCKILCSPTTPNTPNLNFICTRPLQPSQ